MEKPNIQKISSVSLPTIEAFRVQDIDTYCISGLTQPIVKLDITFGAGDAYAQNPLISIMTSQMLLEGTKSLTSKELAEKIDFLGAEISAQTTFETSSVVLACLNKHFEEALRLLSECLSQPRFDETDYLILKQNLYNKLLIDLENVNFLARREFFKYLLAEHPYGRILELEHFKDIELKQLVEYFYRLYNSNNAVMFISGQINEKILQTLNSTLMVKSNCTQKSSMPDVQIQPSQKHFFEKANAVQSAIRIGKTIIDKNHPDYVPLSVTVTVLGGYFGSRLMTTLREEKGYTYGINAFILSHKKLNALVIATEVATEVTNDAIDCIYQEINKLCQHPISNDELENVRSYLIGQWLRMVDGPMNSIETFKSLYINNLNLHFLQRYISELQQITPNTIMTIAQRYLSDGFIEVVVGKKS